MPRYRPHLEETKRKISNAMKGRKQTEEHKRKVSQAKRGKPNPKISELRKGIRFSEDTKRKMSEARKGKKLSSLTKEKISVATKRDKNHNWQGGKSFEPYTVDWNETLKRAMRERDSYICQLCSRYGNTVHHIDYDKKNCNPQNLITLCRSCNVRVNKDRENWINYFKGRNYY